MQVPHLYLIEKIDISFLHKDYFLKKAHELRGYGASHREVARHLGIPRSTARSLTNGANFGQRIENSLPKNSAIGSAPFGFAWIMGELVRDEREQKIIQIMLEYYHRGMSFNAIAKKLSDQKIHPRSAGKWDNGTVRKIILKHTTTKEGTKV